MYEAEKLSRCWKS